MKYKLGWLLAVLPFAIVFLVSLYHPYDPDLGWHLKYGEYFFQNGGVLRENIFSTEMPNYKWANSSWGTDLISYLTFKSFGFLGLSILSAGVITLTFLFFSKASKLDFFEKALIFPLLLYFLAPLNSVSFKGQLLSLLFTGILVFLFKKYEESKSKLLFLIIPLFTVWSNIHGQFILGLAVLALSIFFYVSGLVWQKKDREAIMKEVGKMALIFGGSVLAASINPFGVNIYLESFRHFGNPWQKYISEWVAQEEFSLNWWKQLLAGLILFFGTIFVIFEGKFGEKLSSLAVWPFFVLSFLVRRYLWTTYYLAVPFLQPAIAFFKPPSKKWANVFGVFILLSFLGLNFVLSNPFSRIENMSWESYCRNFAGCSSGAAEFLLRNNLNGELLTFYDWGGFLIWNYPSVKPSIDGRMHLWEDASGYSAFAYYYPFEQNMRDIDESKYNVVLMAPKKPMYRRLKELVKQGKWEIVYEDKYSGVFVRKSVGQ